MFGLEGCSVYWGFLETALKIFFFTINIIKVLDKTTAKRVRWVGQIYMRY